MMFANANRGKDVEPYTDVSMFLPHPSTWIDCTSDRVLKIRSSTAKEFLRFYKKFDPQLQATFDPWMREIEMLANNG